MHIILALEIAPQNQLSVQCKCQFFKEVPSTKTCVWLEENRREYIESIFLLEYFPIFSSILS